MRLRKLRHPVGWGCRICRCAPLQSGKSPTNGATCWQCVATRKDGILVVKQSLIRRLWTMSCNPLFWPLLGLMGGRISPIRSVGWSCQALAPIYFIPIILLNLHLQQVPNTYLLAARRRLLRVNCVERIGIWPVLRTWNWQRLGSLPSTRVYWSRIPVLTKANGFPLVTFPTQVRFRGGWWIYSIYGVFKKKNKTQRNLSESDSDSENEAADFPRFIVIECFGRGLPSQIHAFPLRKGLVRKLLRKPGTETY